MKSKAPLALIEQIIMVLVFGLAAALCVQAFAFSGQSSRRNEARDRAVLEVQNVAETLKYCGGTVEQAQSKAAERIGGSVQQGTWQIGYDENWNLTDAENAFYLIEVQGNDTNTQGLSAADIRVTSEKSFDLKDGPLFEITVAWQEGLNG